MLLKNDFLGFPKVKWLQYTGEVGKCTTFDVKFSQDLTHKSRVAPDIISGPGPSRNPANFHIRPYPAPAGYEAGYEVVIDHLLMHLPHCVIGQELIVLQIR